jgi:hypothetical protein
MEVCAEERGRRPVGSLCCVSFDFLYPLPQYHISIPYPYPKCPPSCNKESTVEIGKVGGEVVWAKP